MSHNHLQANELLAGPDGSNLEVVAWGLRSPCGTAFHPDRRRLRVRRR
jgi:glucose/arabinose dehydrogenase